MPTTDRRLVQGQALVGAMLPTKKAMDAVAAAVAEGGAHLNADQPAQLREFFQQMQAKADLIMESADAPMIGDQVAGWLEDQT